MDERISQIEEMVRNLYKQQDQTAQLISTLATLLGYLSTKEENC